MNISKELQEKINILLENNEEVKKKVLEGDADTIKQIGSVSQKGINPEDIISAYESNDSEEIKKVYNKAKKQVALREVYKELCEAYSKDDDKVNCDR